MARKKPKSTFTTERTSFLRPTGTIGTNLFSNDLLAKIEYPSASTGAASASATDDQSLTYDNLGEKTGFTDQNGTIHAYGYDVLGRLTSDTVTTLGSGVSGVTRRLGYSYNDAGLPFKQTSYYNTSGTNVENQVEDVYNGYGQLITQYQAVAGSVNTSSTPSVQYGFSQPTGANYSREISLTYPNGRVVNYNYNSGIDSAISRLSSMSDSGGNIESYNYLGLSTIVREIRPGSVLTYVKANGASNGDAGDIYTGLDRFGRVVNQLWTTSDTTNGTTGDTLGTITDQFQYGYDQNSNVLYKNNLVHSAASELYHANGAGESTAYDQLNRLSAFSRGTLSASGSNGTTLDTVTTASATNSWSLDALGNSTNTGGTGRTFNSKNQIATYGGSSGITYDHNGNMTTDQAATTYTYDAWNRLISALPHRQFSQGEVYTYNAIGERPGLSLNVCNGAVTTSYYSTQWQDLEDDVTTYPCGPTTTKSTYLWSEGYIDDLIARDTGSTRVYAQQDANHDITSLTNSSGTVLERFVFDPYGARTVLSASWSSASDSQNWVYSFQGGRLDPISGLVNFRNRDLNPTTGTWMEQDTFAGYSDGMDLNVAFCADPTSDVDPLGTNTYHRAPGTGQNVADKDIDGLGHVNIWKDAQIIQDGDKTNFAFGNKMWFEFKATDKDCGCHWMQFVTRTAKWNGGLPTGQQYVTATDDPNKSIYRNYGDKHYLDNGGAKDAWYQTGAVAPHGSDAIDNDAPTLANSDLEEVNFIADLYLVCKGQIKFHLTWTRHWDNITGKTTYGDATIGSNDIPAWAMGDMLFAGSSDAGGEHPIQVKNPLHH